MSWVFIKKQEKRQIDLVVPDPLSVWLGRPMLALSGVFSCWLGSQAVWVKVHSRVPSTLRSRVFSGFTFLLKPVQKLSVVAWD